MTSTPLKLAPGDTVFVSELSKTGEVLELKGSNRVVVLVGTLKVTCELTKIRKVDKKPTRSHKTITTRVTSKNRSSQAEQSIDLHGLCVEDAIAAVEIALDRALLAGLDSLEIIHGKGSGELRKAVHKYLSGMPQVQRFALDPHNSGTTHIKL